ncbi:DUF4835 family protein [Apibacter muscae]|uniref:DUF4835 family protein n=1 Tax=Apibacter muscae TaxID=2509004 RepID=A0A563D7F1_9FLAO|nr:DUF4835 family protein [Apibacter muscae]TWP26156.1 DUF4835 family protein [Apibacter muscae]
MKKILSFFIVFIASLSTYSQELYADVIVNYDKIAGSNTQVFNTLKKDLKDFINNTKWTDGGTLSLQERIKCTIGITIQEKVSNEFKATIFIQSGRPVYNSNYITPLLNFQDTQFKFTYNESENLIFNENKFSGKNLTDVISFYVYMILGYDADSFSRRGGTKYFEKAKKIADNSINQGYDGWNTFEGPKTRGSIITDLINNKSNTLRDVFYQYHRLGLDLMANNEQLAKNNIAENLLSLKAYTNNYQFYPLDNFFIAKREEIKNIFSAGLPTTKVNLAELKALLETINPINSKDYWNQIKN